MVYKEHVGEDKQGNPIFKEYPSKIIFEIELYRDDNTFVGHENEFIEYVIKKIEHIKSDINYDNSLKDKKYAEIIAQIEKTFMENLLEHKLDESVDNINDEKLPIPDLLDNYKPFDLHSGNNRGGRPRGRSKRTIDRYTKVFHKFTIVSNKYPGYKKSEKYELLATDTYDGKKYSSETIKNIIEEKKYLLKPTR